MDKPDLPYRLSVGITLFNQENKVFVGERIDSPGSWQMPQGGIDEGETIEQALFREMMEEIGTDKADILKIHDTPLYYDFPSHLQRKLFSGAYKGQEQTWIALRFTGTDEDISISSYRYQEFQAWQWVDLDDILNLIVPFKRDTYAEVIESFKELL